MDVILASGSNVLEQALAATNAVSGVQDYISGTAAAPDPASGIVRRAWQTIQNWLRKAVNQGVEQARAQLRTVMTEVESLIEEAGEASEQVREALLKQLAVFTQQYVQVSMSCLPSTLKIGEKEYTPKTLKVTHTLVITGSLAVSLEKVLELVGSGQMEVGIDYE